MALQHALRLSSFPASDQSKNKSDEPNPDSAVTVHNRYSMTVLFPNQTITQEHANNNNDTPHHPPQTHSSPSSPPLSPQKPNPLFINFILPSPIRPDIRICVLGDSFTTGAGDDTLLGFPGRLCSTLRSNHACHGGLGLNITCYNLGIRRDTSADILARWECEVDARLKPSGGADYEGRLVFCFGTNDNVVENGAKRVSTRATLANARQILVRAKQKWPTVMLGPPWTSVGDVDEGNGVLSRELEGLCGEIGVPFLELYERLEGNGVWAREAEAGDGIHPNAGGYGLIAKAVEEWGGWEGFVRDGE